MTFTTKYVDGVLEITKSLGEESYAIVRMTRDGTCTLYEIPMYGGPERHIGEFPNACLAFDEANTWC